MSAKPQLGSGSAAVVDLPVADSVETPASIEEQWLHWVYGVMGKVASISLCRIPCSSAVDQTSTPHLIASWPQQLGNSSLLLALAQRAALNARIQRVSVAGNGHELVVAIPENSGYPSAAASESADTLQSHARHILVIHCGNRNSHQVQKILSLGAWCMRSLRWIFPAEQAAEKDGMKEVSLTSFLTSQLGNDGPRIFLLLLDELVKRTASERCYMVCLRDHQKRRRQSRLIGVSGQASIDRRLQAAKGLCQVVEQVYLDNPMSLTAVHEIVRSTPSMQKESPTGTQRIIARLMVPVNVGDAAYVVVLERHGSLPFSLEERTLIGEQLHSAVPVCVSCDTDRLRLRSALRRRIDRLGNSLTGWRYSGLCMAFAAAAFAVLFLVPIDDRISAEFSVEAADKHVLISPGKGYLKAIFATAGDRVSAGQLLAELDDEELLLQQARWQSELQQNEQDLVRALAIKDRLEMSSLKEQQSAINTELSLIRLNQERYRIRAPIDGLVLSGQWHDSLGAALNSGEVLFDIGSDEQYRLVLRVEEDHIRKIEAGQAVGFRLAADPARRLDGIVTAVMPVAVAIEGESHVNVHALLDSPGAQIRPGMSGVGKILIGKRSVGAQWLSSVQDRLVWLGWKVGVLE